LAIAQAYQKLQRVLTFSVKALRSFVEYETGLNRLDWEAIDEVLTFLLSGRLKLRRLLPSHESGGRDADRAGRFLMLRCVSIAATASSSLRLNFVLLFEPLCRLPIE
jgi:hypothetical protein